MGVLILAYLHSKRPKFGPKTWHVKKIRINLLKYSFLASGPRFGPKIRPFLVEIGPNKYSDQI